MTRTPADVLAALRDGDPRDPKPYRLTLDGGLTIEIPSPDRMARVYAADALAEGRDLFRRGQSILVRDAGAEVEPAPVDLLALRAELLAALEALPDREDARRPYNDARLFVEHAEPGRVTAYLEAVVRRVRAELVPFTRPSGEARNPRDPRQSDAEYQRRWRDRVAAAEEASVRVWLEGTLEIMREDVDLDEDGEETPVRPGAVVPAALLRELCHEALAEWIEDGETTTGEKNGDPFRIPRDRIFWAVADDVLGARRRVGKARTLSYTMPS